MVNAFRRKKNDPKPISVEAKKPTALEIALERSKSYKEKLQQKIVETPVEEVGESSMPEDTGEVSQGAEETETTSGTFF